MRNFIFTIMSVEAINLQLFADAGTMVKCVE